jgi:hypothetical protein
MDGRAPFSEDQNRRHPETLGHFLLPLRLPLLYTGRTAAAAWRLAYRRRLAGEDGASAAGTRPRTAPLFSSDPPLPSPSSSYPHSQGSERALPMAARRKVAVLPVAGGFAGDGDGLRRQPVAATLSPYSFSFTRSPTAICGAAQLRWPRVRLCPWPVAHQRE